MLAKDFFIIRGFLHYNLSCRDLIWYDLFYWSLSENFPCEFIWSNDIKFSISNEKIQHNLKVKNFQISNINTNQIKS